jgi:hypothetical protein
LLRLCLFGRLERFEFPFTVVCGAGFDDARLREMYDVIVLPSGATLRQSEGSGRQGGPAPVGNSPAAASVSDPDLRSLCEVTTGTGSGETAESSVEAFVNAGGTVVAAGTASRMVADLLNLPVSDYLVERRPNQAERALGADQYYVPGSILRVAVDPTMASAAGADAQVDVYFNNSPVFRLAPDAAKRGVQPVMWFDRATPLRSGWAWGQNYLEGGTAAFEATVGDGRVFAFGPEVTFRAQPHGTFRFVFNALLQAGSATKSD